MAEIDNEKNTTAHANAEELALEEKIVSGEEEKIYVASYSKLMWWKFRRHKMAMVSAVVETSTTSVLNRRRRRFSPLHR